ncbi:MAG: branched-chain amino acid transaminase [Deltaproteobacteria bacterium]|nr:branched-chain amino acid transaminase [Deltaproteobacteria bacterium]
MSRREWKTGEIEYLFLNGDIVPYEKAVIHIFTPAYRYGAMVFEGIRGYWNEEIKDIYLFRVAEHCKRFNQSLKMMRMDIEIKEEEMVNNLADLVKKNEIHQTVHFIYSAYVDGDGPMSSRGPIGTAITVRKTGSTYDVENGIRCSVSNWRRNADDSCPMRIKAAANYQNSRLALLQAKQDGYDSTIFLNHNGKVSEGPGACLFIVREGRLITPPVTSDILEGVTRDTIIRLSEEMFNNPAIERPIDRSELYIAEEIFFCGSGAEIVPIVNVDGFAVNNEKPGEITRQLIKVYHEVVTGKTPDHVAWRTAVYA